MSSDQEIYESLTGTSDAGTPAKSPCGCGESMSASTSSGSGLAAELESALDALGSESGGDLLAIDDSALDSELLFSDLQQEPSITLQDLVSLAEQYPGLKITISF